MMKFAVTSRPNFVVLIGDLHGWRQLLDEIPARFSRLEIKHYEH